MGLLASGPFWGGCTVAGYAIGYGVDSANREPERRPVRTAALSAGHEVEIELRSGDSLKGEFLAYRLGSDAPHYLIDVDGHTWKVPRGSFTNLYRVTRTGERPRTARRVGTAVGLVADLVAVPVLVISAAVSAGT